MPAIGPGRCPVCEGFGKAIDNFRPPESILFPPRSLTNCERRRSDGRYYTNSPCSECDGTGITIVVLTSVSIPPQSITI